MGNVATTRTFKQGLAAVNADFAITIGSSGAAAWNTTARGALPPMIDDVLLRAFVFVGACRVYAPGMGRWKRPFACGGICAEGVDKMLFLIFWNKKVDVF